MASFKKLKTGWQYRISYKDGDKYRTKSGNGFRTKREAEAAAREAETQLDKGMKINQNPIFADYMQYWFETFKKGKHSVRNDKVIENAIKMTRRFFKDKKIKDITRADYQQFMNWYGKDHATESVRKVHTYCKECLQDALNDRIIDRDPTYRVSPIGQHPAKSEDLKFLNEHEVKLLIHSLKDGIQPEWTPRYMALLAIATGMRFSELLALKWEDVDFDNGTITINKSFDHQHTQKIKTTKTVSSARKITVDQQTVAMLRKYKLRVQLQHPTYLFIDRDGHFPTNNACNKMLKRSCKRAGIKQVTFHALRHTHCSLLIYKGFNIQYISKRMGHANTAITYNIYGHVLDEMQQMEDRKIDNVMAEILH